MGNKPIGTEFALPKKTVSEHYQTHSITEVEHIPEHGGRVETLEFRGAKRELESIEHLGCFICGSMEKRESHHIFERCWGNAFDFRAVAYHLFYHFDFHRHNNRDFKEWTDLLNWFRNHFNGREDFIIDEKGNKKPVTICDDTALDTIYNQLILCEDHHRTIGHSAHGSTFATFTGMFAAKPGFHIALSTKEYQDILKNHHGEK